MDLASLLPRYPGVRLAAPEDNERILRFFHRHAMGGRGLRVGYRRGPDFGRLLSYQGPRRITLLFENPRGDLTGVGAATFRPGYMHGKPETVGYLGDLRMANDSRALLQWRRIIRDLVRYSPELEETGNCRHFLTAVLDRNAPAQAALIRHRRGGFHYRGLARYNITYVLAKAPSLLGGLTRGRRFSERGLSVRTPSPADAPALVRFLDDQEKERAFGLQIEAHELAYRLQAWDGLTIGSFLTAHDKSGRLVAATAPWSPDAAKSIVVEQMPIALKALRFLGNSLRRGAAPLPSEGEDLNALYLTHLRFAEDLSGSERQAAFRALVNAATERHLKASDSRWHTLGFADYATQPLMPAFSGYLCFREPATLYAVEPGHEEPTKAERHPALHPSFEMALV